MALPKSANDILTASDVNQLGPFGTWSSKSVNTVYQAETDGFVVGYSYDQSYSVSNGRIMTASTSIGASDDANSVMKWTSDTDPSALYGAFMVPIRRGFYWQVYVDGVTPNTTIFWLPVGS